MKKEKFISAALSNISASPIDRTSQKTLEILKSDDFIFDIHCHLFDRKTINIGYFLIRLFKDKIGIQRGENISETELKNLKYLKLGENEIYSSELLNVQSEDYEWDILEEELRLIYDEKLSLINEDYEATRGIFDFFGNLGLIRKKTHKDIYEYYLRYFSLSKIKKTGFISKNQIITGLMMDLEEGWKIKTKKKIHEVVKELKSIAKVEPILPYFAVDPRRYNIIGDEKNLYSLFLQAFDNQMKNSFFGVKVYPGIGYFPSDYRLDPIFEVCSQKNIPILSHCGGEAVTPYTTNINAYKGTELVAFREEKRKNISKILNDPKEWRPVLEKYPNLRLCLAHFGGSEEWNSISTNGMSHDSIPKIFEIINLMKEFPGVYTDFSFNIVKTELYPFLKQLIISEPILKERLLYGTDFWVVLPKDNLKNRQLDFCEYFEEYSEYFLKYNCLNYLYGNERENIFN